MSTDSGNDSRRAERHAFTESARAIEAVSRAELVVVFRDRSAHHDRGPLLLAGAVASAALAFMLFTPWEFSLAAIALVPPAAGGLAGLLAAAVPAWERALTPRARRRQAVEQAARAAFVERGIGLTRERTGILVYVSRREREIAVVPDRGVTDCVPPEAWSAAVSRIEEAGRRGGGTATADAIRALTEVLQRDLPRRAGDTNELPDVAGTA